jgi:hypothetical protein
VTAADEFHLVGSHSLVWHTYDPTVKAELFSTALTVNLQTLLIDPIPLAPPALAEFLRLHALVGIVVTNMNHQRAAEDFADRFSLPIFAHPGSYPGRTPADFTPLAAGSKILGEIEIIEMEGAAEGEIALHMPGAGGVLVMGDALINMEPHGFAFLPPKYCADQKQMRQSLRKLLAFPFEQMFFAHGTPLLARARTRLEQLLQNDA